MAGDVLFSPRSHRGHGERRGLWGRLLENSWVPNSLRRSFSVLSVSPW